MNARRSFIVLAIALAVAGGVAARSQEPRQTKASPADAKPSTVTGRITAADTGAPLRRAQITLRSVSPSGSRLPITASTNSRGEYVAKDVPPGSYRVSAVRAGYLTLEYGQRRPGEMGLSVEVRSGEPTERINFALPRGAVLAGRITDELGEPYPGVKVDALILRYQQGRREATPAGGGTTDDLGQFRIAGLEPGKYYLMASSTETWKNEKGEVLGFGSTYYPGGPAERAEVLTLGVSEVRPGLLLGLQAGRTARLSGRVQRESGEPVSSARIALAFSLPNAILTYGTRIITTQPDGTFEIKEVPPGVYMVGGGSASQTVAVAGVDIPNILLVARTGSTVSGMFVTDEGPPPFGSSGVRVFLEAPTGEVLPTVRVVSVDADWSFKMTSLGGPFLFRVTGIPDDWMLSSVRLGDKDITDIPWDVPTGGKEIRGLQVMVTRKIGRVSGTVLDAAGKPSAAATVVVFTEESDLWMPASRFIRAARPDSEGHFSISGLPAGVYRAIAKAFVEAGEWEDRAFLEAARPDAIRVVLAEGASEAITLKLPPQK